MTTGPDAQHHGRYGPEGRACSGLVLLLTMHLPLCSSRLVSGPTFSASRSVWTEGQFFCGHGFLDVSRFAMKMAARKIGEGGSKAAKSLLEGKLVAPPTAATKDEIANLAAIDIDAEERAQTKLQCALIGGAAMKCRHPRVITPRLRRRGFMWRQRRDPASSRTTTWPR